jgi:16S rRNA (cytosine967-C5)-methyltransferase
VTASDESAGRSARRLANDILVKVDIDKAYADLLLDHALNKTALGPSDRGLLTELVYGTLRWRGTIDYRLGRKLRRRLSETDPRIRNLLRLACYQILFLDRVPSYAAVNEAVELAKSYGGQKSAGFVNGVLRSLLRESDVLPADNAAAALSVQYSHPEWLVRRWIGEFGLDEAVALMRANNERAPLIVRANATKCDRDALLKRFAAAGIEAKPAHLAMMGIALPSAGNVSSLPGFAEGWFQVQSESSQLVVALLGPAPGERILDACAAPGGKSTYIAELQGDRGEIVALDQSERGVERIRQNASRLGLTSIRTVAADATQPLGELVAKDFDRILLDAPCSGLGTLRGHPEIKWHRNQGDIRRLSMLQRKLLDNVAVQLAPGGILVYSTCTLAAEENEMNVEAFLADHGEFELEDAARYLPPQARHMTRGKCFQALPQRDNTDGFFAARLRKAG